MYVHKIIWCEIMSGNKEIRLNEITYIYWYRKFPRYIFKWKKKFVGWCLRIQYMSTFISHVCKQVCVQMCACGHSCSCIKIELQRHITVVTSIDKNWEARSYLFTLKYPIEYFYTKHIFYSWGEILKYIFKGKHIWQKETKKKKEKERKKLLRKVSSKDKT